MASELSARRWKCEAVNDKSTLDPDPMFENAVMANFQFQPGSPALGAANRNNSVGVDILGAKRIPTPSIGAYQNAGP